MAEHVPTRGTEIDAAWVEMFQSLVHLVMAANKNTRQYYVEISDQIRCSLVKILKSTEQVDQDLSTANDTLVKQKIRDLCKIAASKLPKKLRLSAKLSVGIWALPDATKRMISEAASIVAVCNEISGLVNTLGIFPVLDTPLQIQFTQVGDTKSEGIKYNEHPLLRNSKSTIHETERQNGLIEMEEISHRYSIYTETSIPTPEQKKIQFDATLLELINQFEVAVSILGVLSTDDRDEIIKAAAKVQMTGQSIIDTIENFEIMQELPSDLIFEETDAEIFTSIGFEKEGIPFPVNASEFINNAIDLCNEEIKTLVSVFRTIPAPVGSHDTLVDCLELVKRLRLCAIAVISKQIKTSEVEREKTEAWNKVV